jgi:secretion/DNA translocation related TadE-like protein
VRVDGRGVPREATCAARGRARRGERSAHDVRGHRETGSATVLVVGAVGVLVTVLTGALLVVTAVHDVHRARSAADLAALAGASAALGRQGDVCGRSSVVARANGTRMTGCVVMTDGSVVVTVDAPMRRVPGWPGVPDSATARARAGVVNGPARPSGDAGQAGRAP